MTASFDDAIIGKTVNAMSGLREIQKATRRRNILTAARRLFLERGYEATTIEAIAVMAAVSAVTVYNHYRTKGGVLLAVVGQSDSLLIEKIRTLLDDPPDDLLASVLAFSKTISDHAISYLSKSIWRHVIATSVIEGSSEFGRGYEKLESALAQLLAELLEAFKTGGALSGDFDCQIAAHVLYNIHNARFVQFMSNDSAEITDLYDAIHRDMAFALRDSARPSQKLANHMIARTQGRVDPMAG
ncbi:MAG: TetR/AcrR family transcriptional regulator [Alphaproteobacteria bacterium]